MKKKSNIAIFLLSLILIGYGFILGRVTSKDKKEDEGA